MGASWKTGWESLRSGRSHPHQLFRKGCGRFLCSILFTVTKPPLLSGGSCPVVSSNPQGNYYQPVSQARNLGPGETSRFAQDHSALSVGAGFELEPFLATRPDMPAHTTHRSRPAASHTFLRENTSTCPSRGTCSSLA